MNKINKWVEELHVLSEIEKIESQAAYTCFLSSYNHKFNYYMRTIPGIAKLLRKVEEIILTQFVPAITSGITIPENERKLLYLAPQPRGLGVSIFEELCQKEYQ